MDNFYNNLREYEKRIDHVTEWLEDNIFSDLSEDGRKVFLRLLYHLECAGTELLAKKNK